MNLTSSQLNIQHKYKWLWRENKLLGEELTKDQYNNVQPLSWYIKQLSKTAKVLAKKFPEENAYNNYFGWQGEVLCEFWLRLFGHRFDICNIEDTSTDQFTRGFDIKAQSFFNTEYLSQIQVKMRGKSDASFTESDLYTFLDEAGKAEIIPSYLILMVPTALGLKREVLSYKNNFKLKGFERFRIITGSVMEDHIDDLPGKTSGLEMFLAKFKEEIYKD